MTRAGLIFLLALAALSGCRTTRRGDGPQVAGFVPTEIPAESRPDARLDAARALVERSGRSITFLPVTTFSFAIASAPEEPLAPLLAAARMAGFAAHTVPESDDPITLTADTDLQLMEVPVKWALGDNEWIVSVGRGTGWDSLDAEIMERLRLTLAEFGIPTRAGTTAGFTTESLDVSTVPAIQSACAELGWKCGEWEVGQECGFLAVLDGTGRTIGRIGVIEPSEVRIALWSRAYRRESDLIRSILENWSQTRHPPGGTKVTFENATAPRLRPRSRAEGATSGGHPKDATVTERAIDAAILDHVRTARIENKHWVETPVNAVISEIRRDTVLNIVELRDAELPNTGVTMDVDDTDAATVLTKVLDPLGRKWVVEHGLVIIKLK